MAFPQVEKKEVVHEKREKPSSPDSVMGDALTVKVTWTSVRRGRKYYYYPRVQLPASIVEQLGIKPRDELEFEIRLERRGEQQALVLVPRREAAHA